MRRGGASSVARPLPSIVSILRTRFAAELQKAASEQDLKALRDRYLGRKGGAVAALMKDIALAPAEDRPLLGRDANELKREIETALEERTAALASARPPAGAVDVTLPGRPPAIGRLHPLTQLRARIEAIFARQGYEIIDGPETEDDWHNFEALNMPPEHPARDMQDTLYLANPWRRAVDTPFVPSRSKDERRAQDRPATLLRTHTSAMQIRYMEAHQPPVRVIAPGRVYRRDNLDLTHTPMFQQVEGLVVGEGVTMGDLEGDADRVPARALRGGDPGGLSTELLPLHRAERRRVHRLPPVRGRRLRDVQAHRLHRGPRLRHGAPGRLRGRRLRHEPRDRVRFRGGHRAAGAAHVRRRRHPPVLRERPALPGAVPAVKVLVSWLRDLVEIPVDAATLARDLHMTGFEVASVEPLGSDPRTPSRGSDPTDAVVDFEITANRPDCLSLIGLAREVATKYGTAVKPPATLDLGEPVDALNGLRVTIEDTVRCPRYCAAVADVIVGPSPAWLADRLAASGIRAISNIVDVTNYVLLELGHPLHAFDLARLVGGHLRVRLARPEERLKTLDGQERRLNGESLVIADEDTAQALAGVMGGGDSEVSASTRRIAIESAWFLPSSVRKTSRKLGLSTEASYRFERGADIGAAPVALARVAALLEQIGAGRVHRGWIDRYPAPKRAVTVPLALPRVSRVLGATIAGWRDPPDPHRPRIRDRRRRPGAVAGRRAHVACRRRPGRRSGRGGGAALRLRPAAHHLPRPDGRAGAPR